MKKLIAFLQFLVVVAGVIFASYLIYDALFSSCRNQPTKEKGKVSTIKNGPFMVTKGGNTITIQHTKGTKFLYAVDYDGGFGLPNLLRRCDLALSDSNVVKMESILKLFVIMYSDTNNWKCENPYCVEESLFSK